jgi:hypothetical protein
MRIIKNCNGWNSSIFYTFIKIQLFCKVIFSLKLYAISNYSLLFCNFRLLRTDVWVKIKKAGKRKDFSEKIIKILSQSANKAFNYKQIGAKLEVDDTK